MSSSEAAKAKREEEGSFKRVTSTFRDTIEKGGKFEPEKGRYYLYVSKSCPWAHRTLIVRKLKGLEDIIPVVYTAPRMLALGWPFATVDPFEGAQPDPLYNSNYIRDLYHKADPSFDSKFTVPVLWDSKHETIVNNESSEIIRIFNTAFNDFLPASARALDLYPQEWREAIDELNGWVYDGINNGVYKAGFATTQEAYEIAVTHLFSSLDKIETILEDSSKDFIFNSAKLTEADVRLFTTIIRFDVAYYGQFKCNLKTIRDGYPNIHRWVRNLYWNYDAFKSTTDFKHIKTSYYSMKSLNPTQIVPVGPQPDIFGL